MAINEGQTIQYTIVTSRVADGTVLYWQTTGNTTNSDIAGGNTGSVTITNNRAVWNVEVIADATTDGPKSLGMSISTGSLSGPVVVTSASPISVTDSSRSPQYTLYFWGANSPIGISGTNDTVANRSSPTQIGTSSWNKISVGFHGVAAVQTNGTLWTWGDDYVGSLGRPDKIYRSSPTQVGALTNWAEVASGAGHCLAVKTDGTLWAWGMNTDGRLGTNDTTYLNQVHKSSPTQVGSGTTWLKVATTYSASFALKTDGTLWAWGANSVGQLGLNISTASVRSSPVQVSSPNGYNWTTIAAGKYSAAGITSNDALFTWGGDINNYGNLGLNSLGNRSQPTQVNGAWSKIDICTNDTGNVGIKSDGTLWQWGYGFFINGGANKSSPTQIGSATNWKNVYANKYGAFATKTDDTAYVWGQGNYGGLGLNDTNYRTGTTMAQLGVAQWRTFASTKTATNEQIAFGATID
jgi:alpha-tubulin suppressor-like RCC1 family protein